MNITVQQSSDVDFAELAAFMFQVRQGECQRRSLSLADLGDRLENVWHFTSFVLARSDGALIGYALLCQIGESDLIEINPGTVVGYILLFPQGDFSEVMSLAVHPDYRRQGYGKLLMQACLNRANHEGLATMQLIVDVKNKSAEALYRQCGFNDAGGNMTFKWKAE